MRNIKFITLKFFFLSFCFFAGNAISNTLHAKKNINYISISKSIASINKISLDGISGMLYLLNNDQQFSMLFSASALYSEKVSSFYENKERLYNLGVIQCNTGLIYRPQSAPWLRLYPTIGLTATLINSHDNLNHFSKSTKHLDYGIGIQLDTFYPDLFANISYSMYRDLELNEILNIGIEYKF